MKNLNNLFISQFEPVLSLKKFRRKGNIFHRLNKDQIIQLFSIKKFRDTFTMQYAIIPICTGIEIDLQMDENRIGDLVGNESLFEWDAINNVENNLFDARRQCEKYLFSWFDYVKDYKTYYEFVLNRHRKFLNSLSKEYKSENAELLKMPKETGFYEVCLCLGEYENAITVLNESLKQSIYAIETNKKYGIEPTLKSIDRQNKLAIQISETMDFQRGILCPDKLIKENEAKTLNSYLKNFK